MSLRALFINIFLFLIALSGFAQNTRFLKPLQVRTTVTAYSSSRRETSPHPHVTASGARVSEGVVACPRKFPFGTKVLIEGKLYECQDRLSRKYDARFDIWKRNARAARAFGKRVLTVIVFHPPAAIVQSGN